MPGAISNPGGGAIPAAGVQNNLNPSSTVAPSATAVLNALSQKASNQALQTVAQTASEAAQLAGQAALAVQPTAFTPAIPLDLIGGRELGLMVMSDNLPLTVAAGAVFGGNSNFSIRYEAGVLDYSAFKFMGPDTPMPGGTYDFTAYQRNLSTKPYLFCALADAVGAPSPSPSPSPSPAPSPTPSPSPSPSPAPGPAPSPSPSGTITATVIAHRYNSVDVVGNGFVDLSDATDIILPNAGDPTGPVGAASDFRMTGGSGLQFPVATGFENSLNSNFSFNCYAGFSARQFDYPVGTTLGYSQNHRDNAAYLGDGGGRSSQSYKVSTVNSAAPRKIVVMFGFDGSDANVDRRQATIRCSMSDGTVLADIALFAEHNTGGQGWIYEFDFQPTSAVVCSVEFFFNDSTNLSPMFGPSIIALMP